MSEDDRCLEIIIPGTPHRHLSPNVHVFWRKKAAAARELKDLSYQAAVETLHQHPGYRGRLQQSRRIGYRVCVSWERGRRGTTDEDNTLASLKAAIDGLARAIGVDDRQFSIRGVEHDRQTRSGTTSFILCPED
jgi:hypothetical protein